MKNCKSFKKAKIYLDMDGVIANFLSYYLLLAEQLGTTVKPPYHDNSRNPDLFRIAVKNHNIFEHISLMDHALNLISFLRELEVHHDVHIEILTSVNSFETDVAEAAKKQKNKWLNQHGIGWKPNFVACNVEKSLYAAEDTILIDDSDSCLEPFAMRSGVAIKYAEFNDEFKNALVASIKSIT